ncbi:histone acetyltransferase GCN5 [Histomonas meleagridis]|uniref:histone acetyltransferase GCN5 n=1 Tax=Histomonas meleagridis TaxID=135588 RepID=UPI003559CDBB|nr:histone acetyltransferase GCN5 [Histomonas meleagridis]KAH0800751.1 histone acetyltransferase GCN5 [Histomonas meleagridis]
MRSFAVDINLDRLDRYADPTQKPIDLGTIRKKLLGNSYSSFSQFIDDIKTMLNNVIEHSNSTDPNHKEALRLSYHICEYLKKIDSNPDISPFDDGKTDRDLTLEVESRIASAIRELQKKKKEFEKGSRSSYETSRYKESQRQSKKITDSELDDLVKSIKQLKSSALIGVVEIIENKPFSETLLPLQINLKHLDERKFDIKKLKTYVDYCKEGNGQHYYAWKPCLPNELQELHSKYESKLMDWLRPPWDCPIP